MVFLTPLLFFFDLTDILIFQSANLQTSNNGRAPEETSDPDVHSHEQGQHHLWQNQALLRVCTWYSITGHWFDSKSKHHHVRFFPQKNGGDKNSIVLPAPLAENGVTQPYENDFYWVFLPSVPSTTPLARLTAQKRIWMDNNKAPATVIYFPEDL